MGKSRRGGGPREDQFGEVGTSQDKQEHFQGGGGRGRGGGGGSAGGGRGGASVGLTYQRQVPKFLQAHAHLLGAQLAEESEPAEDLEGSEKASRKHHRSAGGDASDFEDDEEEALRRAIE